MEIEIKRLTKELLNDYIKFFDETPLYDEILEHACYCVCWSSNDCTGKDDTTVEKRRQLAIEYIQEGYLQGYLAYCDNKVIGWCNTNEKDKCYKSVCGRMYLEPLRKQIKDENMKIKSVFCFAVASAQRQQGVCTKLLEQVLIDAKLEGYDYVEAYPIKKFISAQEDFMGPLSTYLKLGFYEFLDLNDRIVVRKKL